MHEEKYFYWKKFLNGGVAGCLGKTIVAPIDRVKIIFMGRLIRSRTGNSTFETVFSK